METSIYDNNDRPTTPTHAFPPYGSPSPCSKCRVREPSFCGVLIGGPAQRKSLTQHHETAARREILFERDKSNRGTYVICDGWAFRFRRFEDGRRYILNFLIAGDVVYSTFSKNPGFSVQALTDVSYCTFACSEIRARIVEEPRVYDACMETRRAERNEFAANAAALAQFSAAGRIAHLLLQLRDRLDARGMVRDESCAFPLRQSHIADATGLTTVHVSRTISAFRKDGILEIGDGKLTIFNLAALRRMLERK